MRYHYRSALVVGAGDGLSASVARAFAGAGMRIAPNNTTGSAIFRRMSARGNYDQMPLIGSEIVDSAGVAIVTAWINSM